MRKRLIPPPSKRFFSRSYYAEHATTRRSVTAFESSQIARCKQSNNARALAIALPYSDGASARALAIALPYSDGASRTLA